jgi:hypothetical protein
LRVIHGISPIASCAVRSGPAKIELNCPVEAGNFSLDAVGRLNIKPTSDTA